MIFIPGCTGQNRQLDALVDQGMGLGFLFEFGGWVAVGFVFDPATRTFWLVYFGASDCKKILRILAHGDVCHFDVQEVGDMVSHDLKGFGFGVN
jgi:hypothetical protein